MKTVAYSLLGSLGALAAFSCARSCVTSRSISFRAAARLFSVAVMLLASDDTATTDVVLSSVAGLTTTHVVMLMFQKSGTRNEDSSNRYSASRTGSVAQ